MSHPLFTTLKKLTGNARGTVFTEPLWGIPFNLYAPYVSVYMVALGLSDRQIGAIISIGLAFQLVMALLSGMVTDKMGRKRATFIFDLLSWSVPTLIWAVSQNFYYFVAAAIFNSLWRIPMTSWTCLMVEDSDPAQLMDIYSWIYISGLLTAFVAPIAGLLIQTYSLIPTMRGLYIFASVMMTIKIFATNALVKETRQGLVRMEETRGQSVLSVLSEYRAVFQQILKTPRTLYTLGIMMVMSTCATISNTFWAILVTSRLQIPAQDLSYYAFARSGIMLVFFFVAMPAIREMHFKRPMLVGFVGYLISLVILVTIHEKSYFLLLISTLLEACSYATVAPQVDRLVVVSLDAKERARIMSIMYVIVIAFTTPFGWIAGALSQANRVLPFLLNIGFFAIGMALTFLAARVPDGDLAQVSNVAQPALLQD
jgi:DHA1 family tetracycline resistance protein-like MFS transporter